jgi:hypothetical protein
MPSEDPEVTAHVERPAIPRDRLVDSIAVEIGKFVIAGGKQLDDGLAIARECRWCPSKILPECR